MGDLGKLIVAKHFKKSPKVWKIVKSGHTAYIANLVQWLSTTKIGATYSPISVTRSGDLLDFDQLFKAFGNNSFAQISHILKDFL